MKIVMFGYRDWAKSIYDGLADDYDMVYVSRQEHCNVKFLKQFDPKAVFFVGWSWVVPKDVLDEFDCLCLHPSPLPRYRGGSPIQNQVINGESVSAVTLFVMNDKIDSGDIVYQEEISLVGYLDDVLGRIINKGVKLIRSCVEELTWTGSLVVESQASKQFSYYPRRSPEQSELTPSDFSNLTSKQIYDMVRCLQPPYPEVFINCKEGRLILEKVRYEL